MQPPCALHELGLYSPNDKIYHQQKEQIINWLIKEKKVEIKDNKKNLPEISADLNNEFPVNVAGKIHSKDMSFNLYLSKRKLQILNERDKTVLEAEFICRYASEIAALISYNYKFSFTRGLRRGRTMCQGRDGNTLHQVFLDFKEEKGSAQLIENAFSRLIEEKLHTKESLTKDFTAWLDKSKVEDDSQRNTLIEKLTTSAKFPLIVE